MNDALRYEWTRIRTIRSTWWLTGSALGVALLISVLLGWVGHHDFSRNGASADDVEGFGPFLVTQFAASGAIPSLVGFLVAMIGIFAWGHEYRHGMIRASLTALNSRQALWTAKYVVVAVWVAVVSLVAMLMSGLIGLVYLHRWVTVFDGETWSVIAWQTLSTVLLTWLAMAFTALTRSQAFALLRVCCPTTPPWSPGAPAASAARSPSVWPPTALGCWCWIATMPAPVRSRTRWAVST